MERLNDLKNNYGIRLVPVQWKTMLESGIEVDVLNNNLFDLKVFDLCTENNPVKYIFSFRVGDEVITFGVMQRTEVVEKIVDGHVCTNTVLAPLNDHCLEITDVKNNAIKRYSLKMVEEIVPEEYRDKVPDYVDTHVMGNIHIETEPVEPEYVNPFEVEF